MSRSNTPMSLTALYHKNKNSSATRTGEAVSSTSASAGTQRQVLKIPEEVLRTGSGKIEPTTSFNPFLAEGEEENEDEGLTSESDTTPEIELSTLRDMDKFPLAMYPYKIMMCTVCQHWCPPPVYLCANGHLYCFVCASYSLICVRLLPECQPCLARIVLKKIIPYDRVFYNNRRLKQYPCGNVLDGCEVWRQPANYVSHAQQTCEFRRRIKCVLEDECVLKHPWIFWGLVNAHMKKCHRTTFFQEMAERNCTLPVKIFYKDLKQDIILTPAVLNNRSRQKFIPGIKRGTGKMFFWMWMATDGIQHDDAKYKYEATIRLQSKDPNQNKYSHKFILEDCKSNEEIFKDKEFLSVDLKDFEKECIFDKTVDNKNAHIIVEFGIRKLEEQIQLE